MGLNKQRERTGTGADAPHDGASRRGLSALGFALAPVAVAAVLLPLTALFLRAAAPGKVNESTAGPLGAHAALLAVISFVVLGGLAWWFRRRTARPDDWGPVRHDGVGARLDAAIGALLIVATIATPLALFVYGGRGTLRPPPRQPPPPPHRIRPLPVPVQTPPATRPTRPSTDSLGFLHGLVVVLAVILVVAIVGAILWSIGRVFGWWHREAVDSPGAVMDIEEDEALSDAVDAAAGELRRLEDVRAAIIACYAAMEASLRAAGVPRLAADSPEELLARAAGSGTVDTPAAAELTHLFGEARYSTHPLTERHRDSAAAALGTIRANLRERGEQAAGAWAEAAR